MLGWAKEPEEASPLKETEAYGDATSKGNKRQEVGVPSESRSPDPPGFTFSQESADNPYAQQLPYNPSYKPNETIVTAESKLVNEEGSLTEGKEDAKEIETATSDKLENCLAYCIITIMIAAFIAVLASIIYFVVQNPRVAKLLYNVTKEAKNSQEDSDKTLVQKILNLSITKEVAKFINESSSK